MPKGRTALLWLALMVAAGAFLVSMADSQETPSPQEMDVGIIVTRTSEGAQAVLKQLRAGMDFGVLAKENSIDPSADNGGYLGRLNPADLPPAELEALQKMNGEKFTGVVPVTQGFAILTILPEPPKTQDLDAGQMKRLITTGVVRQSIGVAGLVESDAAFRQYPKPAGWEMDGRQQCNLRNESRAAAIERLEKTLADADDPSANKPDLNDIMHAHQALAQLHAYTGDLDASVAEWTKALKIAQKDLPNAVPYIEEALGATYLQLAGIENGAFNHSGDIDLFPPSDHSKPYMKQESLRLAIKNFQDILEQAPDDVQVKWLLNVAYEQAGEYPAGVPAQFLMPPSLFASKENVGRFTDVATAAGLNVSNAAGGVLVDDFENNGLLDVITSSETLCDPLHYFHNNGDGTFSDRTAQVGLADQFGGLNMITGDYNNDGCMDFLVLRGGWEFGMRMSLMKNNCDGTFTDVTHASGLDKTIFATQTAVFADIDNDGYLDLFVGAEKSPSHLFHNKGDGTFEDISHAAGIDKIAFTKGVAAADFDNDGYVDFYVTNFGGGNFLYHNNHDMTFVDVAKQAGVQAPYSSFATWFFDYDNDGWPDIFVTSYANYTDDQIMRSYLGLPIAAETLKLYKNLHNGTFRDVTEEMGLNKEYMPMGAGFGDVDNDGYLDIYMGMGNPSFATLMPHVLLRNDAGKAFVDITASAGTGELHKGHAVSFADLERSGHEDIVVEVGGAVPADKHVMRVFRNPGNDNDWINVKLIGVKSNRSGVGAEIKVTVQNDGGRSRSIYRWVGETSSFGINPIEQHIGLGHGARILNLEVFWPATNTRQQFTNVAKNEFIAVKEFERSYTKLERKTVRLGEHKALEATK
jgi:tetratricopeptide (TPR) repeat protein